MRKLRNHTQEIDNETIGLLVRGSKKSTYKIVLIDKADAEMVCSLYWRLGRQGYAVTAATVKGEKINIVLHRALTEYKDKEVDHIDRNKLNNKRSNLREATRAENCRNRETRIGKSGFRGVTVTRSGTFRAMIRANWKRIYLGTFESAEEAARAYNKASLELHGEFGVRNDV